MANVTLNDLMIKIRRITARPSTNQISNNSIVDYVNLFYQFDFPQELKLFDFHTTYSFITQPNKDVYTLTQANRNIYTSFEPPVFCSGYPINYFQNREQFFSMWPSLFTTATLATTTGIAGPYTGIVTGVPIQAGSVLISVVGPALSTLTATDVGDGTGVILAAGNLTGNVAPFPAINSVNYITGQITITWNIVIPAGNVITVKYVPYVASRPLGILYYDNKFTLRPVPDQSYKIQMQSYIQPFAVSALDVPEEYSTADTAATPLLNNYFQLLAYGASLKIFADSLEMENYQAVRPLYDEQMRLADRKTLMQIKIQRTQTIYSEDQYWSSGKYPTV